MPQSTNKTYLVPLLSKKSSSLQFQSFDRFKKHFPFFKSDFAKVIGFQIESGKKVSARQLFTDQEIKIETKK